MSIQPLHQAVAATRQVMQAVRADQLADPTPCHEWNVAQLIKHIIGSESYFHASMTGQTPPQDQPNWAEGDFNASYDAHSEAILAAFGAQGALERRVELPFGTMAGSAVMGLVMTDIFTHGWDLARATGQSTDLDPELAEAILAQSRAWIQDSFRNEAGNPFGPEQQAPEGAPVADRLAAFLGRNAK